MPVHIRVGGVWKEATVHIKVAGVWKAAASNIKVGGVWKALAAICTAGVSTIANLSDTQGAGTTARVGAKWGSDGNNYSRQASPTFSNEGDDWIGSCANSSYEGRWNRISGDLPSTNSGSNGVWHVMTSDVMVGYDTPADDFIYSGSFTFELRPVGGAIILTDSFTMYAEELA